MSNLQSKSEIELFEKDHVDNILKKLKVQDNYILYKIYSNKNQDMYEAITFPELWRNVKQSNICELTCRQKIMKFEKLGLIKVVRGSILMIEPIQEYGQTIEFRAKQVLVSVIATQIWGSEMAEKIKVLHFDNKSDGRPPKVEIKEKILEALKTNKLYTPGGVVKELENLHQKEIFDPETIKKYLEVLVNEKKISKKVISNNFSEFDPSNPKEKNPKYDPTKRKREIAVYKYNLEIEA